MDNSDQCRKKFKYFDYRTQNNLLREKTKLCYSLSSAYYSFGHDGTTVLEQEEFTGLTTGLAEYILTQSPSAVNMGKVQYDIYYKPPWATSKHFEERHKQVYTEIGTSLKGRLHINHIRNTTTNPDLLKQILAKFIVKIMYIFGVL